MRTIAILFAGAAALWCIQAWAADSASPPAQQSCLRFGEIYSWKSVDPKTLIIEDDFHHKFKVGLMGYCPDLAYKEVIAIKSFGGTTLSCVDRGDDIIVHDFGFPERCPISSIAPYTKEMEAADKAAAAARAKKQ